MGKQPKFEAYGVKGLQSKPWRRTFANQGAFEAWLDKNAGDVEVYGTRDLEEPLESESPKQEE